MKKVVIGHWLLVIGIVLLSGCITSNFKPQTSNLNFTTISKGFYSSYTEKASIVINDAEAWADVWNNTTANLVPQPALPEVDFSKETIIAVFLGVKSTSGYEIKITEIKEEQGKVFVYVKESEPKPRAMVATVLTYPYHIVKTEKITKDVEFQTLND